MHAAWGPTCPFAAFTEPYENAIIVPGPAAWGKDDDTKVLKCGPSVLQNCMSLLSRQVLKNPFPEGIPDSGPDPNACRRICRRARSDPRRHAHDAAWKFSSSSHRAFDAVWNRLTPLGVPGSPGLAIGLPGTQLGCNSPCAVGGDQLPVPGLDVARDPEPRPTSTMLFSFLS